MNKSMIYVQEKTYVRQIDVLELLHSEGDFDVIIWLYPGAKKDICDLGLAQKSLIEGETVTKYGEGITPHKTRRTKLTNELLQRLRNSEKFIVENCDSIVVYPAGHKEWVTCTIGHEGLCLIQDESLLEELSAGGFKASTAKPEWW